jgi:hypothetical protein
MRTTRVKLSKVFRQIFSAGVTESNLTVQKPTLTSCTRNWENTGIYERRPPLGTDANKSAVLPKQKSQIGADGSKSDIETLVNLL